MDITNIMYNATKTNFIVEFLCSRSILRIPSCGKCGNPMIKKSLDSFMYRCNRRIEGIRCNTASSLLSGSFFENMKISFHDFFYILNCWRMSVAGNITAADLGLHESTISRWYTKLNQVMLLKIQQNEEMLISGQDCTVEIDECLFVKRKYHRGRILANQKWIVAGVVRGNIKSHFIEFVRNRKRSTMLEVISRRVAPGSTIITDEWRGYLELSTILVSKNFTHKTVNHSMFYVDPVSGENTNSVEGFWSILKRILRKKGTNLGDAETRLNLFKVEFFKIHHRINLINEMLECI